ncbi:S1 family peptidase [Streptomyces fuscigenes]|uniref:S1 family peptidase n=1 Tax=Streptomyces fuscigenes TaxID=1528880 RepID=UPI001F406FB1|nr:serine protease [Streptomyces fuscigenes]MCF3964892.1 serine protease [Streptomyces fuscigenes]
MKADGGQADTYAGPPRWAARIRRKGGGILGAGILLDADHVLTCAHVVEDGGAYVAEFMEDAAVTAVDASVVPEAYVAQTQDGDQDASGDVALLRLTRPRPADQAVLLHRLSAPNRDVQIYGFPEGYNGGIRLPATLLGAVGRDGRILLRSERVGDVARPGCSGAGVIDVATGRVIGMLLRRGPNTFASGFTYMSPAETIVRHLPRVADWTTGRSAVDAGLRSGSTASAADGGRSPFDHEFAQRLAAWFGDDGHPVKLSVVAADDPGRDATLRRAIILADRELSSTSPHGSRPTDPHPPPPGTVPRAGGHDLALDAAGRTAEQMADRIADRTGLWSGKPPVSSAAERIRRGGRRLTLVVVGVDEAAEPDRLLDLLEVVRGHGSRLLLVFRKDGPLRERAERELVELPARELFERVRRLLDEVTGQSATTFETLRRTVAADVGGVVAHLERAYVLKGFLPATVPDAGTLLALVPDLHAHERRTARALALVNTANERLGVQRARRDELDGRLSAYHLLLAGSPLGSEDHLRAGSPGGDLYLDARRLLRTRPCDVAAAGEAVGRFVAYVDTVLNPPHGTGGPSPR